MIYLQDSKLKIHNSADVATVFQDLLLLEDAIDREKEHFYVMHLDIRNRVKLVELMSIGTLTGTCVHPRETFRRAVMHGSASILVGHNHPSGECDPSPEDTNVTKLLFEAGQILGITFLDHLIFTTHCFFSFKENRVQHMQEKVTRGEVKP
jgi:DNA repair protein RadC